MRRNTTPSEEDEALGVQHQIGSVREHVSRNKFKLKNDNLAPRDVENWEVENHPKEKPAVSDE